MYSHMCIITISIVCVLRSNHNFFSFYNKNIYCSVFIWTNETINIWSHLIGFFLFVTFMFYDNIVSIPNNNGSLSDHVIISLMLIGCAVSY